jgi:cytochrome bd-type quinol oxidase subunit 2
MPPDPPTLGNLNLIFTNIISVAISLVGLAVLAMIIYAGFLFLSAAGDKDATQRAQKTLNYAIRGLVLAVSAWIILNLIGNFIGIDFSTFTICLPGGGGC